MGFRVPNQYRITSGPMGSDYGMGNNGAFAFPSKIPGRFLLVIASDGGAWEECNLPGEPFEHVSVHAERNGGKDAMPTWDEMVQVKDMFWDPEDAVMQLHPPRSSYVNCHPFTLHLWRPLVSKIPLPPPITVGLPR